MVNPLSVFIISGRNQSLFIAASFKLMYIVQMLPAKIFPFGTNKCLIICNVIYYYALTLIRKESRWGRRV